MRARWILLLLAFVVAVQSQAQLCSLKMSPSECIDKFAVPPPKVTQTADDANKKLATANTGTTNLSSPAGSALRDFLALFAGSVDSSTLKESANAVTLDWNLAFPPLGDGRPLKFQAVVTNPELNSELIKALGTKADAISTLRGGLPESGDVTVSATLSPVNARFGRAMGPHTALLEVALNAVPDPRNAIVADLEAAVKAGLDLGTSFQAQLEANITKKCGSDSTPACADNQRLEMQKTMAFIEKVGGLQKAAVEGLTKNAIDPFVRLLNNQPQFYGSVLEHSRDKLVGPNETSAKLTYEMPLAPNLNAFYAGDGRACAPGVLKVTTPGDCAARMTTFAATTGSTTAVNSQSRLAIAAEYHELAKTDINLTQYTVTLKKPGSHSFTGSLTFGYALDTQGDVTKSDRIDLSFSYENVSGDPLKKDRGIGSLTFTKKLSETMVFPISLVYANHAQYLSTVDRKLNVHFGLVYKMPK